MKKHYYTDIDIKAAVLGIVRQMQKDNFKPDYIVGLNRGGLIPSLMLSHFLDVDHYALDVKSHNEGQRGSESNCWMAEDAFGYGEDPAPGRIDEATSYYESRAKNILIVDDINDSGATFQWIKDDWKSSCLPNHERWDEVWGKNVRTAVLTDNVGSDFEVDYSHFEINKAEDPSWIVFPVENWWENT